MRLMVAGAVIVAGAALASFHLTVPTTVRRIEIVGAHRVGRSEIVRLAGVAPGVRIGFGEARRLERVLASRPAFRTVTVTRGLTGTLHLRVVEREPVAWITDRRCAVAEDGVLLPHVAGTGGGWPRVAGLPVAKGRVAVPATLSDALAVSRLVREAGTGEPGVVRPLPDGSWEWTGAGRRIRLSGPSRPDELTRLKRFREAYPDAWDRVRRLDLRFEDRVVASR